MTGASVQRYWILRATCRAAAWLCARVVAAARWMQRRQGTTTPSGGPAPSGGAPDAVNEVAVTEELFETV